MKLYYHPVSPYSRKVLLAMYEKGIDCDKSIVAFGDDQAVAQYKADVNPLGKVPHLVLDDGWEIPESSIIMEYLDTHHDGPKLLPEDPDLSRQSRFQDRMADMYLQEPLGYFYFTPKEKQDPDEAAKKRHQVNTVLDIMDKMLGDKTYAMGDDFSFADISASSALYYLRSMGFDLDKRPKVRAWLDRCLARDSWQRVLTETETFRADSAQS